MDGNTSIAVSLPNIIAASLDPPALGVDLITYKPSIIEDVILRHPVSVIHADTRSPSRGIPPHGLVPAICSEDTFVAGQQLIDAPRNSHRANPYEPGPATKEYRLIPISCPGIAFLPGQLPPNDSRTAHYLRISQKKVQAER